MMYKLRFQKAGPYQWGDINVVVGDIHAVYSLYSVLVSPPPDYLPNRMGVVAEISAVDDSTENSKPIYAVGTFKPPGAVVFRPPLEEDD